MGRLSTASTMSQWDLYGDVAVDGKVIIKDVLLITDSGATIVIGYECFFFRGAFFLFRIVYQSMIPH
jgi:hypothetical protein